MAIAHSYDISNNAIVWQNNHIQHEPCTKTKGLNKTLDSAVYKAQTFMEHWMKEYNLTTTDFAEKMQLASKS